MSVKNRTNMILSEKVQKFLAVLLIAALIFIAVKNMADSGTAEQVFTDVPATHWAYGSIRYCLEHNLINGVGESKYGPDLSVSTAQLATILVRMQWPEEPETVSKDYLVDSWWSPYMYVAAQHGLLENSWIGREQAAGKTMAWRTSRVEQPISRYEMAVLLNNFVYASGVTLPSGTEMAAEAAMIGDSLNIPSRYKEAVFSCVHMGLIIGVDAQGSFCGETSMSRAQLATVIERLQKKILPELPVQAMQEPELASQSKPDTKTSPNELGLTRKSPKYPTRGSAPTANDNGYYTAAHVYFGSAELVYELLDMTNAARAAEGKSALSWVPWDEAEEYTLLRAYECSYAYGHTRPCGESETSVAMANIGSASRLTPVQSMQDMWLASAGHRKTMMGDYEYLCAAKCGSGWVVTFWEDSDFHTMEEYQTAAHNYHVKCAEGIFPP